MKVVVFLFRNTMSSTSLLNSFLQVYFIIVKPVYIIIGILRSTSTQYNYTNYRHILNLDKYL